MAVLGVGMLLCLASRAPCASQPKDAYLDADACFKSLRHNVIKVQKVSGWMECIHKYEAIYKDHPDSSWAPAGMYKAAQLYLRLFELSGDAIYRERAVDLLARIRNRYPDSAYSGRSRTLLSTLNVNPDPVAEPVKHLRSKKGETLSKPLAPSPSQASQQPLHNDLAPENRSAVDPNEPAGPPDEVQDAKVTDLRFWSNPEYTRIVVNASKERSYSHHLLKKDPAINQPFQRLYVDILQSRLAPAVAAHTPINDDLLQQARAGQYQDHTVRVVVDIKSFENYKIFSLKDPFRIVIDVWGKGANGHPPMADPGTLAQTPGDTAPPRPVTTDNLKSSDIARQLALGVSKIVIDPGHGGSDPGAPGFQKGVWEKDIVLKMAKLLAAKLKHRLQCEVMLTRTTDKKLTLEERTAIANTQRADLFISLHCNAAKNKKLAGIETYLLNLATDERAIAVAALENATSEKNISDLEFILSDLMKHAKIEESKRLASDVHNALIKGMKKKHKKINDLGVKQAPFYVLLGARMPSILIETSFISNKTECRRLLTPSYRNDICDAITDGIKIYIDATNPRQL